MMGLADQVDRALRRAMLIGPGCAGISCHRAAERSIHQETWLTAREQEGAPPAGRLALARRIRRPAVRHRPAQLSDRLP